YKPQLVVLMIGTNDASENRPVGDYKIDMAKALDLMDERGIICILSTIPPHVDKPDLGKKYNEVLRELAKARELPLIDYEQEVRRRRAASWNGSRRNKNAVPPPAEQGGAKASSAPTAENPRNSGYLLRGWLSVRKIGEVKRTVLDAKD